MGRWGALADKGRPGTFCWATAGILGRPRSAGVDPLGVDRDICPRPLWLGQVDPRAAAGRGWLRPIRTWRVRPAARAPRLSKIASDIAAGGSAEAAPPELVRPELV